MQSQEEKLRLFLEAINSYAEKQRLTILQDMEQYTSAELDKAEAEALRETIAAERPREEPKESKQETPPAEEKPADTAPTFFVRPVSGAVLREFSGDEVLVMEDLCKGYGDRYDPFK